MSRDHSLLLVSVVCILLSVPATMRAGQQGPTPAPAAVTAPQPKLTVAPPAPVTLDALGMRGFSVALLVGEMQGSSTPDTLPAGARKAITDMRDFLPYKSYRMLDAQWTLCCAGRSGGASGRLRGLEEDEYLFETWITGVSGSKLNVMFRLREAGGGVTTTAQEAHTDARAEQERALTETQRARDLLDREYAEAVKKLGQNHSQVQAVRAQRDEARRRVEEVERAHGQATRTRSGRNVMDSTFSMDVGETVVIGTSRLRGDKALIAVLTAASKSSGSSRAR